MSNLTCSSSNCVHNSCGECHAGAITINGYGANSSSQTTCSSFLDRENAAFVNAVDSSNAVDPNDIKCNATNCCHNCNMSCNADNVTIDAANARCDTFEP